MNKALVIGVMLTLALPAHAAMQGDASQGKRLHAASCQGCHDDGVYTRKDRRVDSLDTLRGQIADCAHMANKKFSSDEQQHLVKYLNETFYKFK